MSATENETIAIAGAGLSAEISRHGAELRALRDADDRDLLWDGDPAFWTGHAPILFPIGGALHDDTLRGDGQAYTMGKHGFARRSLFELVDRQPDPRGLSVRLHARHPVRAGGRGVDRHREPAKSRRCAAAGELRLPSGAALAAALRCRAIGASRPLRA